MNNAAFFFQNLINLSFFLSLRNKVFCIKKLHDHSIYIVVYIHDFFNFFVSLKFDLFNV
jgi:hypothetical protein